MRTSRPATVIVSVPRLAAPNEWATAIKIDGIEHGLISPRFLKMGEQIAVRTTPEFKWELAE